MDRPILTSTTRVARSLNSSTTQRTSPPEFNKDNQCIELLLTTDFSPRFNRNRRPINRLSGTGIPEGAPTTSQDSGFEAVMNFIENEIDFLLEAAFNSTFKTDFHTFGTSATARLVTRPTYTGKNSNAIDDPRRLDIDITIPSGGESNSAQAFLQSDNLRVGDVLLINITTIARISATQVEEITPTTNALDGFAERRYIIKAINKTNAEMGTAGAADYIPANTMVLSMMDEIVVDDSANTGDKALVQNADATIGVGGAPLRTALHDMLMASGDLAAIAAADANFSATSYAITGGYIAYKVISPAHDLNYYDILISYGNVGSSTAGTATDSAQGMENILLSESTEVTHRAITGATATEVSMQMSPDELITVSATFTGNNVFIRKPDGPMGAIKPFVTSTDGYLTSGGDDTNVKVSGSGGVIAYIDGKQITRPFLINPTFNLQRELDTERTAGQLPFGYTGSGALTPSISFRTILTGNSQAEELSRADTYHNFTYMQGYLSTDTTVGSDTGKRLTLRGQVRAGLTARRLMHFTIPRGSYDVTALDFREGGGAIRADITISALGIRQTASSTTQETQPRFTNRDGVRLNMI